MKYSKPPLLFEEQAEQLISRGMISDKDLIISRLKSVSYYRLSGYWYPYRNQINDTFKNGTTIEIVWNRYVFDRQLKVLIIDAIERVEIAVRTDLIYHISHAYGPFGYMESNNLPGLNTQAHNRFLSTIFTETIKSKEKFVEHFRKKYGDEHVMLPMWMIAELIPFGTLLTFFKGTDNKIKKIISARYETAFGVLESWLTVLNTIRNICAHHGRLWNRELGLKPLLPDMKKPAWHHPIKIENNRIFCVLSILKYMLHHIAPQSGWPDRLFELLEKYPDIPLASMGFPQNWGDSLIWKDK